MIQHVHDTAKIMLTINKADCNSKYLADDGKEALSVASFSMSTGPSDAVLFLPAVAGCLSIYTPCFHVRIDRTYEAEYLKVNHCQPEVVSSCGPYKFGL